MRFQVLRQPSLWPQIKSHHCTILDRSLDTILILSTTINWYDWIDDVTTTIFHVWFDSSPETGGYSTHESLCILRASATWKTMSCCLMCDTRKHLVCPCKLGSRESGGGQGDAKNGRSIWVDLSGICSWMIRFHLTPERSCWPRWNEYPFLTGA